MVTGTSKALGALCGRRAWSLAQAHGPAVCVQAVDLAQGRRWGGVGLACAWKRRPSSCARASRAAARTMAAMSHPAWVAAAAGGTAPKTMRGRGEPDLAGRESMWSAVRTEP